MLNESAQADAVGHGRPAEGIPAINGGEDVNPLTRTDYARALQVLARMEAQAQDGPSFANALMQVSVVLKRRCLDFDERDRERLDLLCPHLAFLYRHACQTVAAPGLTQRESEVMHWLACAKTDVEIAALLSISPRTVQKHLEHIYVKLGVETRTAAVMRALALSASGNFAAAQPCASSTTSAPAPPSAGRACTKASTSCF